MLRLSIKNRLWVGVLGLLLTVPLAAETSLDQRIERIAAHSGGTVGVAAVHLESGRTVRRLAAERFPMASVFKLPVALTILDRKTRLPLSLKVKLDASVARPFRGSIAQLVPRGAMLTIEELLDAMLIDSDNTAADALLGLSAGPAGVTARLRALGIDGIRVDRSEGEMALDYASVTDVPPKDQWTLDSFQRAMSAVPRDQQRAAAQRFLADERDTATPDAMLALLRLLVQGKALSKDRTELVLDRMRRTIPGSARIKAGLPEGTVVPDRPGTGAENEGVSPCPTTPESSTCREVATSLSRFL
jgi:beta-lactamase class A